jgi:hypothetical protein
MTILKGHKGGSWFEQGDANSVRVISGEVLYSCSGPVEVKYVVVRWRRS